MNQLNTLHQRSKFIHRLAPFSWLDDRYRIEYRFLKNMGYRLDLRNPKTFNEKLNWMKLYDRNPLYTTLSDKYRVKDYVEKKIGPGHVAALYGVYKNADEIEWDSLPEKYVIKANHGSGMLLFNDGSGTFDRENAARKLDLWMGQNYYQKAREWQYKHIEPRIIIEEMITPVSDLGVMDYKFFCFDGEPKLLYVMIDRYTNLSQLFLDMEWNPLLFRLALYPRATKTIARPADFSAMVEIVRTLAKGLRFCRVDLYNEGRILFGEYTFIPTRGYIKFDPEEYDRILGEYLDTSWKFRTNKAAIE